MYLGEYSIGDGTWVQAAMRLAWPAHGLDDIRTRRSRRVRAVLDNLTSLPKASAALRLSLGQRLDGALFVVAPATAADALRRVLEPLGRVDGRDAAVVTFSIDRAEHDLLLGFPRFDALLALPHFRYGDAWFAFDFRINAHLEDILLEAHAQGHAIAYHLNVEPLLMQPEWLREASRNALRVVDAAGIPTALESLQQELCGRLRSATHLTEEFLGADSPEACTWLRDTLVRRFQERYGKSVDAEFRFGEGEHEGSLVATRHRAFFEPLGVDELCAAAVAENEALEMLAWAPGADLGAMLSEKVEGVPIVPGGADGAMPPPCDGEAPYLFVSYKHEDATRIAPFVEMLCEMGHRVWYDRGIPGGTEWDSVIERRVKDCRLLVLFLSQAAVESRYVRREVKFADSLSRPILTILLDDTVELTHGLGMLLSPYQSIDSRSPAVRPQIDHAIRVLLKQT